MLIAGGLNKTEYEHPMPSEPSELKPSAIALADPADRRRKERRQQLLRALVRGSLQPRRRTPRRANERLPSAVDWHHPQWLAIAILIVVGSCGDALLTLVLVERGAHEWNPLMVRLVAGSALTFALVKVGVTAAGVVFLTQLARIRAFGRLPVGVLLYTALAVYVVLIAYELRLLHDL